MSEAGQLDRQQEEALAGAHPRIVPWTLERQTRVSCKVAARLNEVPRAGVLEDHDVTQCGWRQGDLAWTILGRECGPEERLATHRALDRPQQARPDMAA